jgi:transposase
LILENQTPEFISEGEIEVDEGYFDGRRKGKKGCGAGGNFCFGPLKRGGKVFAEIVPDTIRKK